MPRFLVRLVGSSKVSIERDVYFRTSVQLEQEEEGLDIPSGHSKLPANPKTPPLKELLRQLQAICHTPFHNPCCTDSHAFGNPRALCVSCCSVAHILQEAQGIQSGQRDQIQGPEGAMETCLLHRQH